MGTSPTLNYFRTGWLLIKQQGWVWLGQSRLAAVINIVFFPGALNPLVDQTDGLCPTLACDFLVQQFSFVIKCGSSMCLGIKKTLHHTGLV